MVVTYLIILHSDFDLKFIGHDELVSFYGVKVVLILVFLTHLLCVLLILLHFHLLLHLHLLIWIHLPHHLLLLHPHHLLIVHHLLLTVHILLLLNGFLATHVLSWFFSWLLSLCLISVLSCLICITCNWLVLIAHF